MAMINPPGDAPKKVPEACSESIRPEKSLMRMSEGAMCSLRRGGKTGRHSVAVAVRQLISGRLDL